MNAVGRIGPLPVTLGADILVTIMEVNPFMIPISWSIFCDKRTMAGSDVAGGAVIGAVPGVVTAPDNGVMGGAALETGGAALAMGGPLCTTVDPLVAAAVATVGVDDMMEGWRIVRMGVE